MTSDASGRSTSNLASPQTQRTRRTFSATTTAIPTSFCVFQLYTDLASIQDFLKGPWYADYLNEVSQFVAVPPAIDSGDLVWAKESEQH